MNTVRFRWCAGALVVLVSMLAVPATPEGQAPKGDLWETTSQMSMEGVPFKMPANTAKVCSSREWKEPPGSSDRSRNCKNLNMRTVDNKVTWDVQCTGPTMTGTGEIFREGTDAFSGVIKLMSTDGNMTIQLKGRRLGDCDNPQ
jgi:hypothetical protein